MRIPCEEYILVHSVQEALSALAAAKAPARIVSGGSDLLLEFRQGKLPTPRTLVDVTEIEEMRVTELREGRLFIGASVTLDELSHDSLVKEHAQALADAAALMGNPQVCNVATIGGNVAHALPAADGSIALVALDSQAEVVNSTSRSRVPIQTLFEGTGISALDPGRDLLVGFYLPLGDCECASAFSRRVNPRGVALAMLNMAIWLQRKGDRIADVRLTVGPSGPVPKRMRSTEKILMDQAPSPAVLANVLDELLKEAHLRTSPHRATAAYRRHLAGVLLQEVVLCAWNRAG